MQFGIFTAQSSYSVVGNSGKVHLIDHITMQVDRIYIG